MALVLIEEEIATLLCMKDSLRELSIALSLEGLWVLWEGLLFVLTTINPSVSGLSEILSVMPAGGLGLGRENVFL